MAINIGKYLFAGPFITTDPVRERSGIFAIICRFKGQYFVSDVGESAKLKTRIGSYPRRECLLRNCEGDLLVFIHYTPFLSHQRRKEIVQEIRDEYKPGCDKESEFLFDSLRV